jgi:hypothetical protein
MRRLIPFLIAFIAGVANADTTTNRLSLTVPSIGSTGWGPKINNDLFAIDTFTATQQGPNTFSSSNTFNAPVKISTDMTMAYSGPMHFSAPVSSVNAYVGLLQVDTTGDLSIVNNASYTASTNKWNRIDVNQPVWMQTYNTYGAIPGEGGLQGWTLWRVQKGANPIGSNYGSVGSPELAITSTYNRDMVVGGQNIELDGSGLNPPGFGRFINSNAAGPIYTGMTRNYFGNLNSSDSNTNDDWAVVFTSATNYSALNIFHSSPTAGAVRQTFASWDSTGTYEADLRAAPTLPGAMILKSSGTVNPVLSITPYGNTGVSDTNASGIYMDATNNLGDIAMNIYSNAFFNQGLGSLLRVHQANGNYNQPMVIFRVDSSSFPGANLRLEGGIPSLYFRNTGPYSQYVPPAGEFQISDLKDSLRFEMRNPGNTSFDSFMVSSRNFVSDGVVAFGRNYPTPRAHVEVNWLPQTTPTSFVVGISSVQVGDVLSVLGNGSVGVGRQIPFTTSNFEVGTSSFIVQFGGNVGVGAVPSNLFQVGGGTIAVTKSGHFTTAGTAPTTTSCNSQSANANSNDMRGSVTFAGGAQTACTFNFINSGGVSTPFCTCSDVSNPTAVKCLAGSGTLTVSITAAANDTISYHCDW